jgi:DNA-directed RNA polymerase subunit RPC12/RpoP
MKFCRCGEEISELRAAMQKREGTPLLCLDCGTKFALQERKTKFVIVEVNKSNPVVGTRAELAAGNAKGPRTW